MAGRWKQIDYPGTADFSVSYPGRIFVDGSAAIRVQGLTLDDYAKKSFSRLWKVILTDSASKTATGYFAEADAALALGTEKTSGNLTVGKLYQITGGYEDFTGYNEIDGPGKVTVAANVITLTNGDRDEDYYVTKDLNGGAITNFTHWVDVNVTAITADGNSSFYFDAMSNVDDDLFDIDELGGDCIFLGVGRIGAGYRVGIYNVDGGVLTISVGGTTNTLGNPVYISSSRAGTVLTAEVYSTAALRIAGGAGDVDTITHTVVATTFQFVYGLGSYNNAGTAKDITGTVSNLALKQFVDDGALGNTVDNYFVASSATITLDSTYKVKEVTALGADGCHVVSAKDGSTQNWETIDSGFDYNDTSMTIAIYQWKRHRWSGGRWWRPFKPYKNLWS